jgi:hypothetical protein
MKLPIKPFAVSVVQCRGTPYEVGRAQARLFAATPKGRAFLRGKTRFPWWFKLPTEARMFAKFAPVLWEELAGLADELGITLERAAYCFGNESMRPPIGACSAVMTGDVYGRNYDFRPRYYGAQFTLLQASGSFASIGSTHLLTGRLDGMNEHGLTIGLHQVKKRPRFPGLSARPDRADGAGSVCDDGGRYRVTRRASACHAIQLLAVDANGVAAVVEGSPGAVAVRTGDWLACTNHFLTPQLRPLNRHRAAAHSHARLPPLEAWASGGLSAERMFTALNRSNSPAFHHGYIGGAGTMHTIVGEPAKRRLLIGIGGDAAALEEDMLDVSFDRWLEGEDLQVSRLQGQLGGTAKPFEWPVRRKKRRAD